MASKKSAKESPGGFVNQKPVRPGGPDRLHSQAECRLEHEPATLPAERPAEELLHEIRNLRRELNVRNEALRESEHALEALLDRYADLHDFAPIGFITLTSDGLIGEINLTGAAMLGEVRDQLAGRRFADIVSPADRGRWQQIFMHTLQYDEPRSCELLLRRTDGSTFHAKLDGLHRANNGDTDVVRFAFTSLTEHDQARAGEERMRHILDNTLDMIFIFSPETLRFVYMNRGAIKCVGCSREELLGMTPPDILPMISEAECRAFVAPLVNGKKETLRFETILVCKNGKELPVEARLQLVQEQGDGNMFVAVARDITKRKLAERALRRQKNLLWQVIDADPNMIFVKDENGRFLIANQTIADYYGVAVQDMIGKRNDEINPVPREVKRFLAADREVIEQRHEVVLTELLTNNGKQRWSHTVKRPLIQEDGSVNVLGIGVDITELKLSESRLLESYKALQKLAFHLENVRAEERAQIARNLHDEMGATFAALKMRIAWLASKLPEGMQNLSSEVNHISDLVSDGIRTMRQAVSELRPYLLEDAGLVASIKDYANRFQRDMEIECKVVSPEEDIPLDEKLSVTVFRIIQESLSNVAKHARASKVEISMKLQDGSLLLLVKDNGIGFDPAQQFRSYGLLGIRERALMIGGEARIDSSPGLGTELSIRIPAPTLPVRAG